MATVRESARSQEPGHACNALPDASCDKSHPALDLATSLAAGALSGNCRIIDSFSESKCAARPDRVSHHFQSLEAGLIGNQRALVRGPMKLLMSIALSAFVSTGCLAIDPTSTDSSQPADSTALDDIVARHAGDGLLMPDRVPIRDASGAFTTVSSHGFIDLGNEFFQDLGSNGRRCVSCHLPTAAWSITPGQVRAVFE